MKACKISIVEDDEITALNLKISLEKQNYEVVSIYDNADQAYNGILTDKPEMMIIDISLQDSHDGINLAQEIKEKYDIPFIYLTSHSTDDIIEQAKLTKPYGYIVKPFHPNTLHASIQMALFQYQTEQEENQDNVTHTQEQAVDELLKHQSPNAATVSFGVDYIFNIQTNELFYKLNKVDLKDTQSAFMKIIIAKLGLVVSFEEATTYISTITNESFSIRTLVWRLRNKLQTDIIKNAEGIGYYIEE